MNKKHSSNPKILVIGGSIRSSGRRDNEIIELVKEAESLEDLKGRFRAKVHKGTCIFSNSEILGGVAMYGALDEGAEVDYFSLRSLFHIDDSARIKNDEKLGLDEEVFYVDTTKLRQTKLDYLLERINLADSIIVSTPIYFGDRSSLVDSLLKILHDKGALKGKIFSTISVGAKRNGGQETANVYALFDALNMGAHIIGNGPKTSQYGGTAVAGDKGIVIDDELGIETTLGTGRRSAQVAKIYKHIPTSLHRKSRPTIGVLITSDNPHQEVEIKIKNLLKESEGAVELKIINLIDYRVERCLGCKVCPYPPMVEKGSAGKTELGVTDYACIIDNGKDRVEVIREELKSLDGLIVVGLNDDKINGIVDQYQAFTERTRFIRRGDFEWMNMPFTSLILKNVGSTRERVFGLRVMTSYIRHNMIAYTPIRAFYYQGDLISNPQETFGEFVEFCSQFRSARIEAGPVRVSYTAGGTGGYEDTTLDHTSAERV